MEKAKAAAGEDCLRRFPDTKFTAPHPNNQVRVKFSSADYAKHFLEEKIQNDRTKHTKRDGTVKELSWGPDKEHHTFLQHQAVGKVKRFMHETFEKSGKKADVTGNIWKGIVLLD